MPLLGHQKTAEQKICHYFNQHHNQACFLSGEPGVGKTYIASQFIHDYLTQRPHHRVLVVSPANVIKKWKQVLTEYNPQASIHRLTKKQPQVIDGINLISNHDLTITDNIDNRNFNLLVYDEIHEIQAGRANYEHLSHLVTNHSYCPDILGLTGTIFNQDTSKLFELFKLTNPQACQDWRKFNESNMNNIVKFINRFWQYVSVTINLANVNADLHKTEIEQKIMPIKLIPLTDEERAFYEFTSIRNRSLSNQGDKIASDLIDFPRNDQFITKRRTKTKTNSLDSAFTVLQEMHISMPDCDHIDKIPREEKYVSAISLSQINLTNTQKFNRVQAILKDNPHQTVLILLNGNQNLQRLAKAIQPATQRNVKVLNQHTAPTKRAQAINDYLNQCDSNIMIANANTIKTGIDLNSVNIIIWYQLLNNLSDILQTQRRAHRLSSEQESKVYYLAYQGTKQEKLISQLSQSNTRNASAYGKRSTDALSQLQGIMFKNFQ